MPAPRAEGVDGPVGVADEDTAVRDGRRRVEVLATPETGERGGVPAHAPVPCVDPIDAAAARRDVNGAARVGRRGDDLVVGTEGPADARPALAAQLEGIEPVVPGTEVERLADQ